MLSKQPWFCLLPKINKENWQSMSAFFERVRFAKTSLNEDLQAFVKSIQEENANTYLKELWNIEDDWKYHDESQVEEERSVAYVMRTIHKPGHQTYSDVSFPRQDNCTIH